MKFNETRILLRSALAVAKRRKNEFMAKEIRGTLQHLSAHERSLSRLLSPVRR